MKVELEGSTFDITIIPKKIKNIYFRFDENLNLTITYPKYMSKKEIEKLVKENSKSIIRMYNACYNKKVKESEFWYLGVKYEVIYNDDVKEIEFQNESVICKNEAMLNNFLTKKTKEIFASEVEDLKELIKPPEFTLKIRKMKTRWGVCNYKKNIITLNSNLIRYKLDDLRYVIVHEMCHFYEHNHGPMFWSLVSTYFPNYKEARKELRS